MPKPKAVRRFPINTPGKLYYGPWPSIDMLRTLKKQNVDTVWNLAEELSNLVPLEKYFVPNVIQGDIEDFYIPENMGKFALQLNKIVNLLKSGKNIFVHCFGGHGRTGMTLAAIEMLANDSKPSIALRKSFSATGGPEERSQLRFIKDLYLYLHGKPVPERKKEDKWAKFFQGSTTSGGRRGYFKTDPTTGRLTWVEEDIPAEPAGKYEPAGKDWWESQYPVREPYSGELYEEPREQRSQLDIDWERFLESQNLKRSVPPPPPTDPGQSLSFMEWWGKHPEYKDYDAAKAYWADEQKKIRRKLRKEKVQPEFCPYCGAHLMYPRDIDHISSHFKTQSLSPKQRLELYEKHKGEKKKK
jgi:hypothetical protein